MVPVKAIAFDSYGTLFQMAPLRQAAERRWPGRGDRLYQRWREKQLDYAWTYTLTGRYREFWLLSLDALANAAARLKIPLTPAAALGLLRTYLTLPAFPEVPAVLTTLAGAGLRPTILSEGSPGMLRALVRHNRLLPYLHEVISADAVRAYKPAPEPYRFLAEQLRTPAPEILFVTAHGWDIAGAGAAGLQTAWLNRDGEPLDRLGIEPDLELADLAELKSLLPG